MPFLLLWNIESHLGRNMSTTVYIHWELVPVMPLVVSVLKGDRFSLKKKKKSYPSKKKKSSPERKKYIFIYS